MAGCVSWLTLSFMIHAFTAPDGSDITWFHSPLAIPATFFPGRKSSPPPNIFSVSPKAVNPRMRFPGLDCLTRNRRCASPLLLCPRRVPHLGGGFLLMLFINQVHDIFLIPCPLPPSAPSSSALPCRKRPFSRHVAGASPRHSALLYQANVS